MWGMREEKELTEKNKMYLSREFFQGDWYRLRSVFESLKKQTPNRVSSATYVLETVEWDPG